MINVTLTDAKAARMSGTHLARIGPVMKQFIDDNKVPCILTAIARHGKLAHLQAQGYADVDAQKKIQPDTIFRAYSMTKPITAVAVMLLYEEGKFSLNDPIADYLPCFSNMKVYTDNGLVEADGPITIRHLLTHSAGLTYSTSLDEPAVSALYQQAGLNDTFSRLSGQTLKEYIEALAALPLITHPGKAWRYSEGLSVLARLVEVLTSQGYREFLHQRIFVPLGMVDTDYYVPEEKIERLAVLYEQCVDRNGYKPTTGFGGDYGQTTDLAVGGSGLVTTVTDYLHFTQMLLNGGILNEHRLLNSASVELMFTDQFGGAFSDYLPANIRPANKGLGFGFAGYVVTDALARGGSGSKGEYGWHGWASTCFWIDPVEQMIGMVFTQLIPQPNEAIGLGEKLRQMAYQAVMD